MTQESSFTHHCAKNYASWAISVITACALAGCLTKEPPECHDSAVQQTIKDIVHRNAQNSLMGTPAQGVASELSQRFYHSTNIDILEIRPVRYDKQNAQRTCRATVQMQFPPNARNTLAGAALMGFLETRDVSVAQGSAIQSQVEYIVQNADSKGRQHWIEGNFLGLAEVLGIGHQSFVSQYRFAGQWNGLYLCWGVDGADDGPRGPFEQLVSFDVPQGRSAVLERTTQGGGYEKLEIELGSSVSANGEGANSATDRWWVAFNGTVKGRTLVAKGQIRAPDGEVLRQCELRMEQTPLAFDAES